MNEIGVSGEILLALALILMYLDKDECIDGSDEQEETRRSPLLSRDY